MALRRLQHAESLALVLDELAHEHIAVRARNFAFAMPN
jgi:hypothetical protein